MSQNIYDTLRHLAESAAPPRPPPSPPAAQALGTPPSSRGSAGTGPDHVLAEGDSAATNA